MYYGKNKPEYPVIFKQEESGDAFEEYVQVPGFPLAQIKPEGGSIHYTTTKQGYIQRFEHDVWALGYIITREHYEDNKYKKLMNDYSNSLSNSMHQTKEFQHGDIFNNAFDNDYAGGDGVSLINLSHARTTGGVWSNRITDISDLNELSLEQLLIQIDLATDDVGNPIPLDPEWLVIHSTNQFNSHRILYSELQNDTALNAINAVRDMGVLRKGCFKYHYLDDTDAWFITVKSNKPYGLVTLQRRPIESDQDNEFDTHNFKFQSNERYVPACIDPIHVWGSPGS
jgi:hypothetical protein